jgi:hypothetical protein
VNSARLAASLGACYIPAMASTYVPVVFALGMVGCLIFLVWYGGHR